MINVNPTITPSETKPQLVSEEHFLPVLSGPVPGSLGPYKSLLPVMSGEDLPYHRPTSRQSSLSQPIADCLSTDGGIVQVLLHVVCQCEDDQLSVLTPCSAVLGVSQYRHCNLFSPHASLQHA